MRNKLLWKGVSVDCLYLQFMSHRYFHQPYVLKHNNIGNIFYHLFPLIHVDTLIHCTTDGNEPLREVRYTGYYLFCFLIK